MEFSSIKEKCVVYSQGETGYYFYLIREGPGRVQLDKHYQNQDGNDAIYTTYADVNEAFGEMALRQEVPREETARVVVCRKRSSS